MYQSKQIPTKYTVDDSYFLISDMAKSTVKFDEKGDGLARYTIYNYQKNLADNSFDYKVSRFRFFDCAHEQEHQQNEQMKNTLE